MRASEVTLGKHLPGKLFLYTVFQLLPSPRRHLPRGGRCRTCRPRSHAAAASRTTPSEPASHDEHRLPHPRAGDGATRRGLERVTASLPSTPATGLAGVNPTRPRPGRATESTRPSEERNALAALAQASTVTKKLRPGQPGTKRRIEDHGSALVCVRYRRDRLGLYRITTVELVVDAGPVHPRRFDAATFGIEIGRHEADLRRQLKAEGARWDPEEALWWLRGKTIRRLGLVPRIRKL